MSISFDGLIHGAYDFGQIVDKVKSVYENVKSDGNIDYWWNKFTELLDKVPPIAVTGVLLGLSLVLVFLGKRLLNFTKFVVFFAAGFGIGAAYLAPPITSVLPFVPWWVVGLVVGAVCFVLSKMLYFFLYIGVVGYGTYLFCMRGYILKDLLTNNWMIALVAAGVAVAVALICKKLIEMLGTAALGGFLASLCVVEMLGQLGVAIADPTIVLVIKIAITAVFGIFGFFIQYKTRKRKW